MKSVSDYLRSNLGSFNTLYYPGARFDFSPFYLFALLGGTKETYYADYSRELTEPIGNLGQNGFMRINRNGNEVLWPQVCNQVHNIVGFGAEQPQDYYSPDWNWFWHAHDPIEQGFSVQPTDATAAFVKLRFKEIMADNDFGNDVEPVVWADFQYNQPVGNNLLTHLANHTGQSIEALTQALSERQIQIVEDNGYYIVLPDGIKFEIHHRLFSHVKTRLAQKTDNYVNLTYLNTDGIGTATVLMQNDIKPDVVVLQDHGLGGNYAHFGYLEGQENVFYDTFQHSLPEYLFADPEAAGMWPGYQQVTEPFDPALEIILGFTLPEIIQPMHNNQRALFKLNT